MRRRRQHVPILPVALLCLLAACGPSDLRPRLLGPSTRPDPRTAIALSVSADAIYLVDPETGGRRTLVRGLGDFRAGYAAWGRDHLTLAYADGGIVLLHARTGRTTVLADGTELSTPAWSAGGRRIAYQDGRSIWVREAAGGSAERLALPETLSPVALSWGPSEDIAFAGLRLDCTTASGCVSTDLSELWRVEPDGTGLRQLTRVGHAVEPKWSPDASRLLFVRRLGGEQAPRSLELWEVGASGARTRQVLALYDVVAADWSPDGRRIVIVRRGERPGTLQAWIAAADGSTMRAIGPPVPGMHATVDW